MMAQHDTAVHAEDALRKCLEYRIVCPNVPTGHFLFEQSYDMPENEEIIYYLFISNS
jgi:hypothetical protein